jgi:hypothetical protein
LGKGSTGTVSKKLAELSTIVRNTCRAPGTPQSQATFQVTTLPNPKQQRALELIQHLHL